MECMTSSTWKWLIEKRKRKKQKNWNCINHNKWILMQWEQRVFSFSLLLFSSLYSNLYQFFSHFWTPLKTSLFFYFFIFALFFPFPEKKNGKPHSPSCPKNPHSIFFFFQKKIFLPLGFSSFSIFVFPRICPHPLSVSPV